MSELSSLSVLTLVLVVAVVLVATPGAPAQAEESLGWKPHFIRQGDGQGGWRLKPAECQILRYRERGMTMGYGLAQMDNGEIVLIGMNNPSKSIWYDPKGEGDQAIIAFSSDRGDTWSPLELIPGTKAREGDIMRPLMLTYLGEGNLYFRNDMVADPPGSYRYFTSDYGRTWSGIPDQPTVNGKPLYTEGNALVDRDEQGRAIRIGEIGYNGIGGIDLGQFLRWSEDGGRTWGNDVELGMGSEGSLVRARNGWLVSTHRTALSVPAGVAGPQSDNQYRTTLVSISKDDGQTWSDPQRVVDGRMHANLLKMPNGDLVMTVVVRMDAIGLELVSYRRGFEAIISHDNGLTWDVDRKYILDEWEFYDALAPAIGQCGHLYSTLLDDGSILTVLNNYLTMGMTLVRWRP